MKNKIRFLVYLVLFVTIYGNAQTTLQASTKMIVDDGYDYTELSVTPWGGSHGLFFGSYMNYNGSNHLWENNNTVFAQGPGQYDYGAFSMGYIANGGIFSFYDGGRSTGAGTPVPWTSVMSFHRGGNISMGASSQTNIAMQGNVAMSNYLRVGTMPASTDGQFRVLGQDGIGAVEASSNRTVYLYSNQGYYGISAHDYNTNTPLPLTVGFANASTYINPNGGSVGIGTTNPGAYKLAVNGDAIFTKVKVKANSGTWPDYVFHPSYKLPSLQEVEPFIKQYNHLPGIACAKEVEEKGLDVGENQAALLKKIEELTLYIIDMKKELNELKAKVNKQKSKSPATH